MVFRLALALTVSAAIAVPVCAQRPPAASPPPPGAPAVQDPDKKPGKEEKKPLLLELGKTLPRPIALPDIDGDMHRAQQLQGKVVVVTFWSTTCPIMKGWEDRLVAIHEEYTGKEVVFLMVNSNEGSGEISDREPAKEGDKPYQKIRDHLKERKLPYEVLVDHGSAIADLFQAKTTPDIFVFDKAGVLVYRGLIDDDPRGNKGEKTTHYLRGVLDKLSAGEAVELTATRPIGCSIKRPSPARERGGSGRR